MNEHPKPPFSKQQQPMPGETEAMQPVPDHGEKSYRGSGRLLGKRAIITGGDSGIGRAVAIAYAREGADVLVSYLNEHQDAKETERWIKQAGRQAVLVPGDIERPEHCRAVVEKAKESNSPRPRSAPELLAGIGAQERLRPASPRNARGPLA